MDALGGGAVDPGRRHHDARGRAGRDLDADAPRAARAHVLEVPLARDARPDPRRVHRHRARGRAAAPPARAAALQRAGVRDERRPRDRALDDPRRHPRRPPRALERRLPRDRRQALPGRRRRATSASTSRSRSRTSTRRWRRGWRAGSTPTRSRASTCSSRTGSCARSRGWSSRSPPSGASRPQHDGLAGARTPARRPSTSATRRGWRGPASPPASTATGAFLYLRFGARRRPLGR